MGKREKDKGARGERLFRDLCREYGFTSVQRGGQAKYQRGSELADITGLPGCHVEVKFVEKLNTRKAMQQSIRDSEDEKAGNLPILAHKVSRGDWLITMRASDWFTIFKGYRDSISFPF